MNIIISSSGSRIEVIKVSWFIIEKMHTEEKKPRWVLVSSDNILCAIAMMNININYRNSFALVIFQSMQCSSCNIVEYAESARIASVEKTTVSSMMTFMQQWIRMEK